MTHYYYYAGGKLLRETYNGVVLDFFYDQNGHPFAFKYNGTLYYYITNLQGDVEYILDSLKTVVASYKYDPYGNLVSATGTMALNNPLLYRGYYFDGDTGFYYLQSRYYDPKICRFINADALVSTGQGVLGNNMFAYCRNNPVCRKDISGTQDASAYFDDGSDGTAYNEPIDPEDACAGGKTGTSTGENVGSSGGSNQPKAPTYPANPNDFNPKGLTKEVRVDPGKGSNGGIIQWMDPDTNTPVFEWNEDRKHVPHYHAMMVEWGGKHDGSHQAINSLIEEPWKSRYF